MKNNKKEYLYNLVDKEVLKEQLHKETFKRITLSFYRYVIQVIVNIFNLLEYFKIFSKTKKVR